MVSFKLVGVFYFCKVGEICYRDQIFNYFVPLRLSAVIFMVDSYRIKLQNKE